MIKYKFCNIKSILLIASMFFLICCNNESIEKLGTPLLLGGLYSGPLKGEVASIRTKRTDFTNLTSKPDSVMLQSYIDSLFIDTSFWKNYSDLTTFLNNGKIHYAYTGDKGNFHKKYIYDQNGYLSERLYFGGQSRRFYYKEYFVYNLDTTYCKAEKYSMRNIENPIFDDHAHVDESDSLFLIEAYENKFLLEESEFFNTPFGSKETETWYEEGDSIFWQKVISEKYEKDNLELSYRYLGRRGNFISKGIFNEHGDRIEFIDYRLLKNKAFYKDYDFENRRLNELNLEDKEFAAINPGLCYKASYRYDLDKNIISREQDSYNDGIGHTTFYKYDKHGNWVAQISTGNKVVSHRYSINLRKINYKE